MERLLRRRAEPEVEIDLARAASVFGLTPMLPARLVAQAARDEQLAELARLDDLDGLRPLALDAALRAVLDDPVVLPRGLDGDAAFVDVVAARLLDVDVLARLAGPDGHQRRASGWAWRSRSASTSCRRAPGGCPCTVAGACRRLLTSSICLSRFA